MSVASINVLGSNMNFTSYNHSQLQRNMAKFLKKPPQNPEITSSQSPPTQLPEVDKDNYMKRYKFPFIDEVTKYEKLGKIGHGTFGEVFKARDRNNQEKVVALKKILMENETEGFPITG